MAQPHPYVNGIGPSPSVGPANQFQSHRVLLPALRVGVRIGFRLALDKVERLAERLNDLSHGGRSKILFKESRAD
jgi:hypothetical protein